MRFKRIETGFIPVCNQNIKVVRKYIITLKSDTGKVKITTYSTGIRQAIKNVLDSQCAPFRAIKVIQSIPLK